MTFCSCQIGAHLLFGLLLTPLSLHLGQPLHLVHLPAASLLPVVLRWRVDRGIAAAVRRNGNRAFSVHGVGWEAIKYLSFINKSQTVYSPRLDGTAVLPITVPALISVLCGTWHGTTDAAVTIPILRLGLLAVFALVLFGRATFGAWASHGEVDFWEGLNGGAGGQDSRVDGFPPPKTKD